ncbi:autophagy protein 12-like [Acanthaster planci]|uniref:Ubiquitin-like protein ATG12 n=1 Tax=Acanthaster planci TaxID=133434 RepID=A0A8B7XKR3_ACAPL|nr:autophagy protein 12-like [Acanthaster planci]
MAETDSASKTDRTSDETGGNVQLQQDRSKEETTLTSPNKKRNDKVDILLKATADAPIMKKKKWAVDRTKKVSWVIEFIRKYIKCDPSESLFLYVNQAFAPSPDQEIGNLFECYGSDGKLVLHYCKSEAWG